MLNLDISQEQELRMEYDSNNIQRFSMCKLLYKNNNAEICMCEDYLYVFIENMMGRIKNIPNVNRESVFGKLGKWQEYFYYDSLYVKEHLDEIEQMKKAIFISTENYGIFLYKFKEKVWLEIDKGLDEACKLTPYEYYDDPDNYQVQLLQVSDEKVCEWSKKLVKISERLA